MTSPPRPAPRVGLPSDAGPARPSDGTPPAAGSRAVPLAALAHAPGAGAIRLLIPSLQVISLLCLLVSVLAVLADSGPWATGSVVFASYFGAFAVLAAILWIWRARHLRRHGEGARAVPAAIAVTLAVVGISLQGAGVGFSTPAVLLVVMLLVIDIRPAAGVIYLVVMVILGLIPHTVNQWYGSYLEGFLIGLVNTIPVAVLNSVGLAFGMAMLAYRARLADAAALLAERDAAFAELTRRADVEKDLVLSQERTRAARELHDGLGHRLTVIGMSLEFAGRMRERDADAAWLEVSRARGTAREALEEMRMWVRALSPSEGADGERGLAALESIAESFRGTGVQVTVDSATAAHLPLTQAQSLLVYRVVQEGLTNALRHARSHRVEVDVRPVASPAEEGRELQITVTNDVSDTHRPTVSASASEPGFGHRSLAERARDLGGDLEAGWQDLGGETPTYSLRVRLPLTALEAVEA